MPRAKGVVRDADPAGFGDAFKPGGYVDAIAEYVVAPDQHIAEMDADAPFHATVGGGLGIALCRQPLQPQSAFDGADHRAELDKYAIAGRLHNATAMLGDQRISGAAMLAQGPVPTSSVPISRE